MSKRTLTKTKSPSPTAVSIDVELIDPHPDNPRETFDDGETATLAASLNSIELLQPITVEPAGDRFRLLAGERRWRAAKLAGWRTIPCFVRKLPPDKAALILAEDNLHHRDLNPVEQARAVALLTRPVSDGGAGLTQAEVARRLGKEPPTICNLLRLLNLPPEWQREAAVGGIMPRQAKALASYADRPDVLAAVAADRSTNPDDWHTAQQFDEQLAQVAQRVTSLAAAAPPTAGEKSENKSPGVLTVRRLPAPSISYLIDCIGRVTKREDLLRLSDAVAERMEAVARRKRT